MKRPDKSHYRSNTFVYSYQKYEKKEGEKQRAESLSGSKDVGNERLAARCSYFIGMGV